MYAKSRVLGARLLRLIIRDANPVSVVGRHGDDTPPLAMVKGVRYLRTQVYLKVRCHFPPVERWQAKPDGVIPLCGGVARRRRDGVVAALGLHELRTSQQQQYLRWLTPIYTGFFATTSYTVTRYSA